MATEDKKIEEETKETKEIKEEEANKETKAPVEEKEEKKEAATPAAPPKPTVHKINWEKDVVYLYQFSRTPVIPSISPYCLKVETWLRLAGIKYENVDHKTKLRSKKGQLPFVEVNGEEIADSTIIMQELSQRFGKDVDALLTNEQKNIAHAMIAMIENHLVWVVMAWRSKYPETVIKGYKVNLQNALGTKVPAAILNFLFKFTVGRKILNPQGSKKVRAHGIGVHKPEEILKFGQEDLKVLSELLADKPFFFGDEPSTLDIVAFANLAQIYFLDKEVEYPLREFMQENHPNLVGLINRIKERCFTDWEDICKTLDLNAHLPKPPPEEKEPEKKENKDDKEKKDKEIKDEVEKEKDEKKEMENENEVENKLKDEKEKEAAK